MICAQISGVKPYEGLDISPKMLKVARRRNPGLRLHLGDMATFHLPRRFDAVICLFSAIAYANTPTRFRRAIRNLAGQVAPGGVLVVDAWLAPGVFTAGHVSVDEASDGITTVVRVNRSSLRGRISIMEWHFLVATARRIDHFTERHEVGLFEPDEYIEAMEAAGLSVDVDPAGCHGRGRYFGRAAA